MSKPHITSVNNLPSWLTMAAQIYPPQHVALVGAGNGTGPLVHWLQSWAIDAGRDAPAVTLLEPHVSSMAQLAKRLADTEACAEWRLLPDLLAPEHGEHTYHQYTLAAENGLLPPEALHTLWPSLQLQSQQLAATVVLAQLLPAGWLLLDCLPAAHLLQGSSLPVSTQVVLARVVLSDAATAGSSLASVQALLASSGFKAVAHFAERNSILSKALFVRDPNGLQEQLLKVRDVLKKSNDDLDKEKQQTASKLTTQQKQITDLQNKVIQLESEIKNLNLIQLSLSTEVLKAEAQMDLIKELTRTTNS